MLGGRSSDSAHMECAIRRLTLIGLVCVSLGAASGASASTLLIAGAGDGHGVGMSQDGADGYAEHGWSYDAILDHYYRGTEIGGVPASTVVKVLMGNHVKRIPLETYVRGVVSAEVPSSWPMAALEAQAVASRTYAITAHAGGSKFDVYPDTRSQMYLGKAAETPRTNAAVAATAGQIVTYGGKPAITYFYADSGGHTESVQYGFPGSTPRPWLVGVADAYDSGPSHKWTVSLSFTAAAKKLSGLVDGAFKGIEVLERGSSPRIVSAYVLGSKGRTLVSGGELAGRFGVSSTWMYFSVRDSHGTHAEPDASAKKAPPPPAQPAQVSAPPPVQAAGGSAATPEGGSSAPTSVSGQGGVSAG
jgi:stage II sporulation protein D